MSKMNIQRIKQTQLHKDILLVFGSIANASRILGFPKITIYKYAKSGYIPEKHIPQAIRGFNDAKDNLINLREKLLG